MKKSYSTSDQGMCHTDRTQPVMKATQRSKTATRGVACFTAYQLIFKENASLEI